MSTLKTLFWQIPSGILWWPPMLQSLHNEKSLSGPKINKNVVQMLVQLKKRHSVGLIATFSSRVCILQRMYKNSLITERQQSSCYLALTSVPNLVCIYWATTDIVFILFDLIPTVEVWILLKCWSAHQAQAPAVPCSVRTWSSPTCYSQKYFGLSSDLCFLELMADMLHLKHFPLADTSFHVNELVKALMTKTLRKMLIILLYVM